MQPSWERGQARKEMTLSTTLSSSSGLLTPRVGGQKPDYSEFGRDWARRQAL